MVVVVLADTEADASEAGISDGLPLVHANCGRGANMHWTHFVLTHWLHGELRSHRTLRALHCTQDRAGRLRLFDEARGAETSDIVLCPILNFRQLPAQFGGGRGRDQQGSPVIRHASRRGIAMPHPLSADAKTLRPSTRPRRSSASHHNDQSQPSSLGC